MNEYAPMSDCTAHALDYCCEMFDAPLSTKEKENLCSKYTQLPAFPDCKDGLKSLHTAGHRIFAFSNGTRNDISNLLKSAPLIELFEDVIVVDDMEIQCLNHIQISTNILIILQNLIRKTRG